MIFLGTTFCSGKYSLFPPAVPSISIIAVQIFDGVYNQLFLSTDSSLTINDINEWDINTQFNATFDKDFSAGNTDFSLKTTDYILVKRREVNETEWTTIFTKAINSAEDFKIFIKDTYARAGIEYEYCVTSVLNGVESSYSVEKVYSNFDGFFITDQDCIYGTILDVDGCDTSRNISSESQKLFNSKYMTAVSNSESNCDSGSITGTFMKFGECYCGEYDGESSLQFRKDFMNRLASNKPFILKIADGRRWLVKAVGTPTDSKGGDSDIRQISFEWVEIGDVNDMKTLYYSGLSDVDSRWW